MQLRQMHTVRQIRKTLSINMWKTQKLSVWATFQGLDFDAESEFQTEATQNPIQK